MSERRMFTQKVTESDAFLDMPTSTQALYFHLCMNADDDGFVNNPRRIQKMVGSSDDDAKILVAKSFIIPFENGIIVIKHWRMHNLLRKDRYKPTEYSDEKNKLYIKENGAYTLDCTQGKLMKEVDWQPNGNQMAPQYSIGKYSIDKNNINNNAQGTVRFTPPTIEDVQKYCKERKNDVDAQNFVDFYESKGWMVGKNKMKDWKACVRTWEKSHKIQGKNAFISRNYTKSDIDALVDDLDKINL